MTRAQALSLSSAQHEQILDMIAEGLTWPQIGAVFGYSDSTIRRYAARNGLHTPACAPPTVCPHVRDGVVADWNAGKSATAIASALGIKRKSVESIIHRAQAEGSAKRKAPGVPKGQHCANKLTAPIGAALVTVSGQEVATVRSLRRADADRFASLMAECVAHYRAQREGSA